MTGPDVRPLYVGQTVNEKRRAAAHETEASKCKLLRDIIIEYRSTCPGWRFADNFKRIPALAHGCPFGDVLDAYECFFIQNIVSDGTINHHKHNPDVCNQNNGPNYAEHRFKFGQIEAALEALEPGESLYTADDERRARDAFACLTPIAIAQSEHDLLEQMVELTRNDDGSPLPEIDECFQLTVSKLAVLTNVQQATTIVTRLVHTTNLKIREDNGQVDALWLAKEFNDLKSNLFDYIPDNPKSSQAFSHTCFTAALKTCSIRIGNGDDQAPKTVEAPLVLCMAKTLQLLLKQRESYGAVPARSFQSIRAWLKPGTDLKGGETDEKKLERANEHLQTHHFSDEQREEVLAFIRQIEARIHSTEPLALTES